MRFLWILLPLLACNTPSFEFSGVPGTLGNGEYGLFINLGSFARGAIELERNREKLRLLGGDQVVDLVFEHYAKLSPQYRSLLPLKQIFVPDSGPLDR